MNIRNFINDVFRRKKKHYSCLEYSKMNVDNWAVRKFVSLLTNIYRTHINGNVHCQQTHHRAFQKILIIYCCLALLKLQFDWAYMWKSNRFFFFYKFFSLLFHHFIFSFLFFAYNIYLNGFLTGGKSKHIYFHPSHTIFSLIFQQIIIFKLMKLKNKNQMKKVQSSHVDFNKFHVQWYTPNTYLAFYYYFLFLPWIFHFF